jgi:hypothetical protein
LGPVLAQHPFESASILFSHAATQSIVSDLAIPVLSWAVRLVKSRLPGGCSLSIDHTSILFSQAVA